ncbi:MAG: hypothetical protein ACK58L_00030 [Planctomycetota bacterium]
MAFILSAGRRWSVVHGGSGSVVDTAMNHDCGKQLANGVFVLH